MRVWGITGTNGKTTVTWILAEFLKAAYVTTVEVNTLKRRFYTGYTTPPLNQLKDIFSEMESSGAEDCVMEVSSHAIHQRRTGDTVFAGGAFTNLSEDHLDYHKTMEEYFRVKLLFAERIADDNLKLKGWEGGIPLSAGRKDFPPFVVCMDGGYAEDMLKACGRLALNVIPVSIKNPHYDLSGLQLVGDYNKSNVLVAAALAEAAGISREKIASIIPLLKPRWGRLEKVESRSKATVYVDFAHTPDGIEKVLGAISAPGKLWVVFGAGGDRDPMKRSLMGEAAARGADVVVLTSDNPRSEDPEKIIDMIELGVNATSIPRAKSVNRESDRKKAIYFALENASVGDVIVICGKGHETTQEIAGVKYPFDDREVVRSF